MFKKLKSKKGFTLIELIVVIAILAILMLLIAPRFLGFTENAKISADKAAASTLEKSVQTLIATQELNNKNSVASITVTKAGAWSSTGNLYKQTSATPLTDPQIETAVENLTGDLKLQSDGYNSVVASITSGGAVTATLNP